MPQVFLGQLVAKARKAKGYTQDEVAALLGMTRPNYSHIETGDRNEVLKPDQAIKLCRALDIDMLQLVLAMGYPVRVPGVPDPEEAQMLVWYRGLDPAIRRFVRAALEQAAN